MEGCGGVTSAHWHLCQQKHQGSTRAAGTGRPICGLLLFWAAEHLLLPFPFSLTEVHNAHPASLALSGPSSLHFFLELSTTRNYATQVSMFTLFLPH